jgi:predicted transport protein
MGLESKAQEKLYSDYWYPMEQSFGHANYAAQFDRFMRDYLTVKTGHIPNIGEVYAAFKAYAQNSRSGEIQEIVADIYRFSKYFVNMALGREPDEYLRRTFSDINTLKVDVAYPFFLEVYDDYAQQRLGRDELLEIFRLAESYVFRRVICGIPTNSMNKTFANLGKELDKERYLESYKAALQIKDSYRRFPDDEEFKREFVVKDVYNFRSRNYLLRKLENYDRKELVDVEGDTIEHIMPQNENLLAAWRTELGESWRETHKRYLHTIGNLTLTGYNSELSDRPFAEKRDIDGGFADSPIRLNRGLAKLEGWNEAEIRNRAEKLAEQATKVWPCIQLPPEVLDRYRNRGGAERVSPYTLADHPHLTGEMLNLFEQLRLRILNIDSSVTEQILKLYIAYKTSTNFVDVIPRKSRLNLSLNIPFDKINDPQGCCKDITDLGRWGNGDVEAGISNPEQLDYAMF